MRLGYNATDNPSTVGTSVAFCCVDTVHAARQVLFAPGCVRIRRWPAGWPVAGRRPLPDEGAQRDDDPDAEVRRSGGNAHERLTADCLQASASDAASGSGPRG